MEPIIELIVLTAVAGGAIPLGGLIASFERIRPRWLEEEFRHTVFAFGGGALFSSSLKFRAEDRTQGIVTCEQSSWRSRSACPRTFSTPI